MPRLELPTTVAARKQETKEAYINMKAFNTDHRLKCQLNSLLQESENVTTNHPKGATYAAQRNCGNDLALILRIHRLFLIYFLNKTKVSQERRRL